MTELFDKLIVRIFFSLFICGLIYAYRFAHILFYPSTRKQILREFSPSQNPTDALHLFSRLVGVGILFWGFHFHLGGGIFVALLDLIVHGLFSFVLYLLSLYIVDSIVLYNFEYKDEIIKRKNYCYALICFSHHIAMAFLIKTVLKVANDSLIFSVLIWLFALVIFGLAIKLYPLISYLPFNRLMVQRNISLAFSYMGLTWGTVLLITSSLDHQFNEIKWYIIAVLLKLILSSIILPIFFHGLIFIFNIKEKNRKEVEAAGLLENKNYLMGRGILEGIIFFTASFLTAVITGQIHFHNFYPNF